MGFSTWSKSTPHNGPERDPYTGTELYRPASFGENNKKYASETAAELAKLEYSDYRIRFEPEEERLLELSKGRELLDQQLSRITANSKSRRASRQTQLEQSRFGVLTSDKQQASNTRQDAISSGLSIAHAKNNSRIHASDQQMGVLTGGSARAMPSNKMGDY